MNKGKTQFETLGQCFRKIVRIVCGIVAILSLIACSPLATHNEDKNIKQNSGKDDNSQPVTTEDSQAQVLRQKLEMLLTNAQQMFSRDRLMVPPNDNAFYWYLQVLRIDETNEEAHAGMEKITERYLALAQQAFTQGNYDKAKWMLNGAEKISAPPKLIKALRLRYQRPASASNEFRLNIKNLNARNSALTTYLEQLTGKLVVSQSRLLIVARNDAEGRWIYQQMRSLANGFRLRGNIEIGSEPKIILIDLDES